MGKRLRVAIAIGISLTVLLASSRVNWRNLDGKGTLVEISSKHPVAGAALTLDCGRFRLFHGSETIRQVHATSAQNGQFEFEFKDTWDCDFVFVRSAKSGYQDAQLVPELHVEFVVSPRIPRFLYLVPMQDISKYRLDDLLNRSKGTRISPVGPMPVEDYMTVYLPFVESKKVASGQSELDWIRQNYCGRLSELYAVIDAEGIARLSQYSNVPDYTIEVVPFCWPAREAAQGVGK